MISTQHQRTFPRRGRAAAWARAAAFGAPKLPAVHVVKNALLDGGFGKAAQQKNSKENAHRYHGSQSHSVVKKQACPFQHPSSRVVAAERRRRGDTRAPGTASENQGAGARLEQLRRPQPAAPRVAPALLTFNQTPVSKITSAQAIRRYSRYGTRESPVVSISSLTKRANFANLLITHFSVAS